MKNVVFLQVQKIENNSNIFGEINKKSISYSYFRVQNKYYLFCFQQTPILCLDFFYNSINVVDKINFKARKIRSFRGFLLYALEIIRNNDSQILETNLSPDFWNEVENIIRQNKKDALFNYLFGENTSNYQDLKIRIDQLEKQVTSLQQKITHLETNKNPLEITTSVQNIPLDVKFKTPLEITNSDKVDIIKKGFLINKEQKISLKMYYEKPGRKFSVFAEHGFSIKYDSIRRISLYKKLKAENS